MDFVGGEKKKTFKSIKRARFSGGIPYCGDGALALLCEPAATDESARSELGASEWLGLRGLELWFGRGIRRREGLKDTVTFKPLPLD